MTKQLSARECAEYLDRASAENWWCHQAAAELRRLDSENAELKAKTEHGIIIDFDVTMPVFGSKKAIENVSNRIRIADKIIRASMTEQSEASKLKAENSELRARLEAAEIKGPHGWIVSGTSTLITGIYAEETAKQEAKRCGGTAQAIPLYAPLPPLDELKKLKAEVNRLQNKTADLLDKLEAAEKQEPVAWLHEIVDLAGEPDQVLSFSKDDLPFSGVVDSLSVRPLYAAPVPVQPVADERQAFESWAAIEGYSTSRLINTTDYFNAKTFAAWEGWQARAKLGESVPDGWQLVPVEPTPEMLATGNAKSGGLLFDRAFYSWKAMLAAAPKPEDK